MRFDIAIVALPCLVQKISVEGNAFLATPGPPTRARFSTDQLLRPGDDE
jgi:hypothetical protein